MTNNSIQPYKTTADYLAGLVGQPWTRSERHCWRLVTDVQREMFGRDLPLILGMPNSRKGNVELFAHHVERRKWAKVEYPDHGAVALMRRSAQQDGNYIHAGVYLDIDGGMILHSDDPHGVVLDSPIELYARGWIANYFVPVNSCTA